MTSYSKQVAISVTLKENGLYTPEGVQITAIKTKRNSELVLVDSQVVVNAPARLFAAGMGDAMATWLEAKANYASCTPNYIGAGFRPTKAAMAIAKECNRILLEDGRNALAAVKKNLVGDGRQSGGHGLQPVGVKIDRKSVV